MLVIKNLDSRDKVKLFAVIFNSSLDFHCLLCSDFLSVKVFFFFFFCLFFSKKQTNKQKQHPIFDIRVIRSQINQGFCSTVSDLHTNLRKCDHLVYLKKYFIYEAMVY